MLTNGLIITCCEVYSAACTYTHSLVLPSFVPYLRLALQDHFSSLIYALSNSLLSPLCFLPHSLPTTQPQVN